MCIWKYAYVYIDKVGWMEICICMYVHAYVWICVCMCVMCMDVRICVYVGGRVMGDGHIFSTLISRFLSFSET